ncbi:ribbon-helix-helix protein, CopG family [Pseudomonas sp. PARCl1]|jgi:hypothetical protein|uniref:ribbon-helix-helix protein, CopG family n=1 Tax=Pseudomonas sp. PARCl1 TaxID=2853444 RepID=UPI001C794325|nr:ribbon-helix-helix protein, CopG family [Pseudomonas sp. PARCl1]QXM18688.1 hypothetical protein [Pseudomonas phage PARCL1pr]
MASLIERARPAAADPAAERIAAKVAADAPDSGKRKNVRGKREMFSVGLEPELLAEVDAFRARHGLSRPALIKIALRRLMDAGL